MIGNDHTQTGNEIPRLPSSPDAMPERCLDCGEWVWVGMWPFCTSLQNPAGHERGTYMWKAGFSMKTQGWARRLR